MKMGLVVRGLLLGFQGAVLTGKSFPACRLEIFAKSMQCEYVRFDMDLYKGGWT